MEATNNQQGGLQASKHYFLSTEGKRNKSLCFVKLTDSALHSIKMYLESKDSCLPKPTIQFVNNTGVISLSLDGETKKYEFTLSNMEGDGLQSNFQCIQQADDGYLDSLGSMLLKLQIHAKEDSYETTKSKMAAADQAQKKFCTKEIKQNGVRLGQKLISKRPELVSSPEKKNNLSAKNLEPVKPNTSKRKNPTYQAVVDQPIRKRIIHILAVKPYRRPELMLRLIKEGISEKDKQCIDEVLADVGSLKGNFYSLNSHAWAEVIKSWKFCSKEEMEIIQRKKQQFLKSDSGNEIQNSIHTQPLTFNTQSKSLNQNGVLSKSVNGCKKRKVMPNGINSADKTLKDVSPITSSKNNFSFVNKDQTFPNPTLNGNSTFSSNKNSSVNTQMETPLNHPSMRRHFQAHYFSNQILLDFKSSLGMQHFLPKNILDQNLIVNRTCYILQKITRCLEAWSTEKPVFYKLEKNSVFIVKNTSVCENTFARLQMLKRNRNNDCEFNIQQSLYLKGLDPEIPSPPSPPAYHSEIRQKYTRIESVEQRKQYEKDFRSDYDEYARLYKELKEVSDKFVYWENRLNSCAKGSNEYNRITDEVNAEMKSIAMNTAYYTAVEKYERLKSKMSYIKNLINEYDCSYYARKQT